MKEALIVVCAGLVLAQVPAQGTTTPVGDVELARVRLIEEQEGDLRLAEREYRKLLSDGAGSGPVLQEAELRLGALLWRLDRKPEARPLLARAARGSGPLADRARAVLSGQDPQGMQAQEVTERTRAAIAQMFSRARSPSSNRRSSNPIQDILWLGAPAVPELLRQVEERRAAAVEQIGEYRAKTGRRGPAWALADVVRSQVTRNTVSTNSPLVEAAKLLQLVWRIGGPDASRYLTAAASDSDARWRCLATYTGSAADHGNIAASMLPVIETFLLDADPNGDVAVLALAASPLLPIDRLVPLFDSPVAAVREVAWQHMTSHPIWHESSRKAPVRDFAAGCERAMAVIERHLIKALADPDPAAARMAFEFLVDKGASTRRGVALLLEHLPRVPAIHPGLLNRARDMGRVELADLLVCARALGPFGPEDGKQVHRQLIASLASRISLEGGSEADRPTSVNAILELVELGYDGSTKTGSLLDDAIKAAVGDAELVRAAGLVARCGHPSRAIVAFLDSHEQLPAAAMAPLRDHLQQMVALKESTTAHRESKRAKRIAGQEALGEAVGRTGNPDAVPFLRRLPGERPDCAGAVVLAALGLSERSDDPRINALLRELLVNQVIAGGERSLVFAELARRGDVEAIPLYPRAYALGLRVSSRSDLRRGVHWLSWTHAAMNQNTGFDSERLVLHGYDDSQLVEAWRTLLTSDMRDAVLGDLHRIRIPEQVRRMLIETVARDIDEIEIETVARDIIEIERAVVDSLSHRELSNLVRRVCGFASGGEDHDQVAMRTAALLLCRHQTHGSAALRGLSGPAVAAMAEDLRSLLGGVHGYRTLQALRRGQVTLCEQDFLSCLAGRDIAAVLKELPAEAPPAVVRRVEELVANQSSSVRMAAISALGRMLASDSVAVLLSALRDPDEKVRAAATGALEAIRLYHQQKAFWEQFGSGVQTGREAAAARLLLQARPDQPVDQRLLAIQSLGALGAPEALPYLIDWSRQGDDEKVKQAARAAIAKIHQAAGGG